MKKKIQSLICLSFVLMLGACSTTTPAETSSTTSEAVSQATINPIELKKDFYEAINGEWISAAVIPSDQPVVGGFTDLNDSIEEVLQKDFAEMLAGTKEPTDENMKNFVEFYRMATDFDAREKAGTAPLLPYTEQVEQLTTLSDYSSKGAELVENQIPAPFALSVMADMGDASKNSLYISEPNLLLGDKSYYEDEATKAQLQELYSTMSKNLLVLSGKTEEEASDITQKALAFDESLVATAMSGEESSDYTSLYNPVSFTEFCGSVKNVDFTTLIPAVIGSTPETVVVTNPKYFAAFDQVISEGTFDQLKSWMLLQTVTSFSSYLTEDMRIASNSYSQALTGTTESMPKEKIAYYAAAGSFSEVVGIYYGETYFGEEAKKDVTNMTDNLIRVYKNRLNANTWLSEETKEMAVKKLENMTINIGYPEEARAVYSELKTVPASDGGTFIDNAINFTKIYKEDMFSKLSKPVDRGLWPLSANTVNAMYSPTDNSINFPAAILQAPFYSKDQSDATNYGGIGAVIGHEISHAFDPNGSKFDEKGSLNNWWTEEDYAKFNELSEAMVKEFEGIEFADGTVNGTLTLSENVADAGGLSCALEAVKEGSDVDLTEFFQNWAVIWRQKATPEYESLLLTDVHAPNKLRANIQLENLEDFYTTYDIVEGDEMYRAPEDRVSIW